MTPGHLHHFSFHCCPRTGTSDYPPGKRLCLPRAVNNTGFRKRGRGRAVEEKFRQQRGKQMTFLVWEKSPSEEWSWRAAPEGALLGDDLCYENHVTTGQKDDSRGCPGDALGTFWCSQCEQKKKEMVTQREGENLKELEVEIRKLGSKGGAGQDQKKGSRSGIQGKALNIGVKPHLHLGHVGTALTSGKGKRGFQAEGRGGGSL